ncbi:cofactor-independent phosphoglycerate mutase [Candidatus Margulisiibacteriota bacterium]
MKYVILIGDGMSDWPLKKLGGKTPLEAAKIPNMDFMARNGISGLVKTVPKGMKPGSDIANLALFGYDPKKYYSGRAPLEALNMGIDLSGDDVAFRCNTVTVKNGKMIDYSAGHIKTSESTKLIRFLGRELGSKSFKFYPGVSYRHLLVVKNIGAKAKCTPPHDITGRPIQKYLPKGPQSDIIKQLMFESKELLEDLRSNKTKCNMMWLWGQGKKPKMPSFKKKYGKKGSVISAVNLVNGIGVAVGLKPIKVPGVTGYLDTNYVGKAKYALKSLKKNDFVFVHVESPDESGHEGNIKHKIKAIQDFDKYVVGTILKGLRKFKDYKILVLPDHATPISIMTHSGEPVPFALYSSKKARKGVKAYSEKHAAKSKVKFKSGPELINFFFKKA